ncbi:MAG: hypothetical protein OXC41_02210 [Gammaproteobacteria bacterium]|nr:hypothetical protein [Gammaproteobacteria bacterium]
MNDVFRHLHVPADLACEFLAVFSRMEYALKATGYASDNKDKAFASWDTFANEIAEDFKNVPDKEFVEAVDYLLKNPPRKQVQDDGELAFKDQVIDGNQKRAQQALLMVRTVRNNLFHGGKYLPNGEKERGRNRILVAHSLTILKHCAQMNDRVMQYYES